MSYLQEAFNFICKDAKKPESWFVCLMENVPFYGGPEEGGWWGSDQVLVAFQEFPTEEMAEKAKEKVLELAEELSMKSKQEYGEQCLREMDFLDQKGLEADWLPEPDGPSEYFVVVCDEVPENSFGCRHYE